MMLAEECFEQALEKDPDYALALTGLADLHTLSGFYGLSPAKESTERARELVERALRLDERLSEAHNANQFVQVAIDDWDGALRSAHRALELNPKYPDLHNFRGIVLCELERFDEALAAFRRSAELSPSHLVPRLNLAFAYLRADRRPEGQAELQVILAREPSEAVAKAKLEELRSAQLPDRSRTGVRS